MISKVKNLIKRDKAINNKAPSFSNTTFIKENNQWYLPTMVGPSTFIKYTIGAIPVRKSLEILSKLSPDKYLEFIIEFYNQGLERHGEEWVYADINTVLLGLSSKLNLSSYLEIGVRRGRSMAMVASQSPTCYIAGFDMWIENYAGMPNPGEQLVRDELLKVGHKGKVEFFEGDSKKTIPEFFEKNPEIYFDMITVDGDHSLEGARIDLLNVIPRLKVGGILVFDDISNHSFYYLNNLWNELVGTNSQFASYSFTEVGFGIAFAIKKY